MNIVKMAAKMKNQILDFDVIKQCVGKILIHAIKLAHTSIKDVLTSKVLYGTSKVILVYHTIHKYQALLKYYEYSTRLTY